MYVNVCRCVFACTITCTPCDDNVISHASQHLVLPVHVLGMLYDSVAQLEDVANGLISLLQEILHLEQRLATVALHRDAQQVEYLEGEGRGSGRSLRVEIEDMIVTYARY